MTDDQQAINKFLTELPVEQGGFGECWHEWIDYEGGYHVCVNEDCNWHDKPHLWGTDYKHPDYFTDSGFVKLLRHAKESEGWEEFIRLHGKVWGEAMPKFYVEDYYIDPAIFARKWAEFCGFQKG